MQRMGTCRVTPQRQWVQSHYRGSTVQRAREHVLWSQSAYVPIRAWPLFINLGKVLLLSKSFFSIWDMVINSVFIPIPKKGNAKECSNYCTVVLISHTSKVVLKILQARLQQYVNRELPDVQAGFRKGIGTRDQIANICWIIEKAREFQKNIYFCFIDYAKAFDCVDHNELENSERDGNTRPPDLPLEKPVCRSGSNS